MRDGAMFGRGAADTKSNILAHVGALRAWDGKPPVGIKLCIEGYEEIGERRAHQLPRDRPGALRGRRADHRATWAASSPGVPTLTTALRGMANVIVEARTLESGKHSGQYGGAAPDALLAVLRALASLHDEHGNVAVAGLQRNEWEGGDQPEDDFRKLGTVLDGMPLIGTGGLGSRVWSGPAITVTGIDVPSVDGAVNAVSPYARAVMNVRVHPGQDAVEAQNAVIEHLRAVRPFGIELERARPGRPGTASRPGPTVRRTRRRARCGRRPGAPTCCSPAAAARSRSSARSPARCRTPRRCWSGPPTATRTSTVPTSASC